jgi:glycosyltransferase involved in cell wall biosynthesis
MPLVSVIIPNYNHGRFLERRISSVLEQTFTDFEIILLDDASTDNSREIIARYAGHPRVRTVLSDCNSGSVSHQWNAGVSLSKARYVWIAEADDIAHTELLATLVSRLESRPSVVLAYAQSWFIDEFDQRQGDLDEWTSDIDPARWKSDFVSDGTEECANCLSVKNTIPNASAVVFRRDAFLKAGAAHEGLRLCGDWMTWARLLLQGEISFVAKHLNHFRRHSTSVRATTGIFQNLAESLKVTQFIMENVELGPEAKKKAASAMQNSWWEAIRYNPLPTPTLILHFVGGAAHFGPFTQMKLLAMVPAAGLARFKWMEPLLHVKRKLTSRKHIPSPAA